MKISYKWLSSYVPEIPDAQKVADLITFHVCEIEDIETLPSGDSIFDLKILPDRAHDLLSHQGVARELAGLLGCNFKDPTEFYTIPVSQPTDLKIDMQHARRYMGRIVRSITVGPSPEWVKKHLESIGQRSINNIVDATNIVMYDCGQPTHAFDLDKIVGGVTIRNAKIGEKMTTLDNKEVVLLESDVVIADQAGVLALAGVKGGKRAQVDEYTKNILIEVANFYPVAVRKTARRVGILTDSAKRFENDLSPSLCDYAMRELCGLFVEYGFKDFEDVVDVGGSIPEVHTIVFTTDFINKKLGAHITSQEIETILNKYGYSFSKQGDVFEVRIPSLRLDLRIPEDMVEEIGRVYGYEKIVPVLPKLDFTPQENTIYTKMQATRAALAADGYREVMTYAFTDKGEVEVLASASDKKFLRANLSDGIKKAFEFNRLNAPLLGLSEIKIFEIGTVFKNGSESITVCYADKKGVIEMTLDEFLVSSKNTLERSSNLLAQNSEEERGQTISKASFDSTLLPQFTMWSMYPFMTRDVAVWVPEGTPSSVLAGIYKEFGTELLQGDPTLFDQFTKNGRTSYAFRLVFQSYERTLTDDEVNSIMSHIYEKLSSLNYEVR